MIRFLHTADWQIGKPFGGFEPERRAELRAQRFATVARIAALAAGEGCAAVLVAGDAFDDNTIPDRDLMRTLDAMSGFSGTWVMLPGNHDAALAVSVWSRLRAGALPANILIADEPQRLDLAGGRLAVLPAPLTRRREGRDLTEWFDHAETDPGMVRLGLAHGSVANRLPAAAESGNPIADNRAASAGLDYLALGDWHGFLNIADRTWYSGTPEPDRFPENEPGHVALVEIAGPGAPPQVKRHATGHYKWSNLDIALAGDAVQVEQALSAFDDPLRSLINLRLTGNIGLAARVEMESRLTHWSSRFFELRVHDAGLGDLPDPDDLDRLEVSGFVRAAMERLQAKSLDPADPSHEAAALALRLAYAEYLRMAGQ